MPHANTRFHAIGQGCFYSGEIYCTPNGDPFRIVYDCGSETGGDALDREVELFHQIIHDAKLDVLVLSHLDADHVNGLTLLLDNGLTARNVFLPYLSPAQRALAAAGAGEEADPDYFELLANPVGFLEARGVEYQPRNALACRYGGWCRHRGLDKGEVVAQCGWRQPKVLSPQH